MVSRLNTGLAALLTLMVLPTLVVADLPTPRLDILQPVGLVAGNTTEVLVQGNDLDGCETLLLGHPGLRAEFVKAENPNRLHFKLSASGDVPTGTYDVYASGRFGISNPRVVHVVRGVADVLEVEPNNNAAMAQIVALNVAISGQGDGNNQDFFQLPLKTGQRITIDCWSARLETEMDPTLAVYAANGQQLASNSDYYGRDPLIDFIAPA
ncbi:MAG TPA: hypothetical protein VFG20_16925, partial [Planctomycetaceae bacterium]|nr:hypothetical protein [Planctomycetaceae bacterium]